jgi:hypothetical protein
LKPNYDTAKDAPSPVDAKIRLVVVDFPDTLSGNPKRGSGTILAVRVFSPSSFEINVSSKIKPD